MGRRNTRVSFCGFQCGPSTIAKDIIIGGDLLFLCHLFFNAKSACHEHCRKIFKRPTKILPLNTKLFLSLNNFCLSILYGHDLRRIKCMSETVLSIANWNPLKQMLILKLLFSAHGPPPSYSPKQRLLCFVGVSESIGKELGVEGLRPMLCAGFAAMNGAFLERQG